MGRLFGTDGIRGVAGKELTLELARNVGCALINVLKNTNKKKIVIGMDTRESSVALANAIAEGICLLGADAHIVGVCSTPAVAYLVKKHSFDAGVMISASHNPFEYNGIKIFGSDGFKLSDALEDEIESHIGKSTCPTELGKVYNFENGREEYIDYIKNCFGISLDGLRIAIDCANGSASSTAEQIFAFLGADCHIFANTPDGRNINENCGSTHLDNLKNTVVEGKFDLGIAFDGDADRCLAIDDSGREIDGDFIMAILAIWLRESGKLAYDTVVGTVMSNLGFVKFCEANGFKFIATKVGDRYVLECMNEHGYSLGGEQSGHLILNELATTGDGQLTALALLSRIKESGKSLSTLADVMKQYPQYMVNVYADSVDKAAFGTDSVIKELIAKAEESLKGNGRLLIRPSGTEHLIRVMAEGESTEAIKSLCDNLAAKISARLAELKATV